MNLTELQINTVRAIVTLFETGKVSAASYNTVTLIKGDSGHLTYGKFQASLTSGGVYSIVMRYINAGGALSAQLKPYLDKLHRCDISLDNDSNLKSLLKQAGDEEIMHKAQEEFFNSTYMQSSIDYCDGMGLKTAMGLLSVYDGNIHGSWKRMKQRTDADFGTVEKIGEKEWVKKYCLTRRAWLAGRGVPLSNTVYRMNAMLTLISNDNWNLDLPFKVRGVSLTVDNVGGSTALNPKDDKNVVPGKVIDLGNDLPLLYLTTPNMTGNAVTMLQQALTLKGFAVKVDGWFGVGTDKAVKDFQLSKGLIADGRVGPRTWASLQV